jgi:hypothetical protein
MNRVCDRPFDPSSVGFNCWLINGGGNGYVNRQQFAQYLADILFDNPPQRGIVQFRYPPLPRWQPHALPILSTSKCGLHLNCNSQLLKTNSMRC